MGGPTRKEEIEMIVESLEEMVKEITALLERLKKLNDED